MNLDDLIATAQPRTEKVRICVRGDLVAAHAAAVDALNRATSGDDSLAVSPEVIDAAAAVTAIEDEQEAHTVEMTVESVSRNRWANLLAQYPPTKEQRRLGHFADPDRFPIAMVAACVVELEGDVGRAEKLADVLSMAEWDKLERTALRLNATEVPHPKLPAATELVRANGHSSTTSDPEGSPEAGSLAGSGAQ